MVATIHKKIAIPMALYKEKLKSLIKKMATMQFWVHTKSQLKVINSLLQKTIRLQYL